MLSFALLHIAILAETFLLSVPGAERHNYKNFLKQEEEGWVGGWVSGGLARQGIKVADGIKKKKNCSVTSMK